MRDIVRRLLPTVAAVLALTACPTAPACQEDVRWTLERCEQEAIAASRELRAGTFYLARADAAAAEAHAARWPTLHLVGNYTYTSEAMTLDLPQVGGFQLPHVSFGDGRVYDLSVALNAPVFAGGALRHMEEPV